MCEIDEVDRPAGSDPIGLFATFVKREVLKLSEVGRALKESLGSSILSSGTINRIGQSYAEGILSNRFIDKVSARVSQLSAPTLSSIGISVDMRPQRMENIARDTLEAHLQILRRLNDIALVADGVQLDRATQQQKDSRNLKIAMASLIASVVLSLVTIGITNYGVREADAAGADSGRQYQQALDLQRQQLDEAKLLAADLHQQFSALPAEIRSTPRDTDTSKPDTSFKNGPDPKAHHPTH